MDSGNETRKELSRNSRRRKAKARARKLRIAKLEKNSEPSALVETCKDTMPSESGTTESSLPQCRSLTDEDPKRKLAVLSPLSHSENESLDQTLALYQECPGPEPFHPRNFFTMDERFWIFVLILMVILIFNYAPPFAIFLAVVLALFFAKLLEQ